MDNSIINQTFDNFKILQINLQRCKAVNSCAYKTASDNNDDIIAFQEPYKINNEVVLLGQNNNYPKYKTNYNRNTGITVLNNNLDVLTLNQYSNEYITTVLISNQVTSFYLALLPS